MSIRDLLLNILIGFGFVGFVFATSLLDSMPLIVAQIVAVILWLIYIVIVIRDHQRDIKYPLIRYRPDKSNPTRTPKRPQTTPYDQEEDKG